MHRTTISLPDELASALAREAKRRSQPASAVARDALRAYLGIGGPGQQRELPFAGIARSGQLTTARDMEDLLEEEWKTDARDR